MKNRDDLEIVKFADALKAVLRPLQEKYCTNLEKVYDPKSFDFYDQLGYGMHKFKIHVELMQFIIDQQLINHSVATIYKEAQKVNDKKGEQVVDSSSIFVFVALSHAPLHQRKGK